MKRLAFTLLLGLLLVWLVAYVMYRSDLAAVRERLLAGSEIADTACGSIEYRRSGNGPAVLAIHGSGGGYHKVSSFARHLAQAGHQLIAMSRFGYLRTPMPADASAQAQADAHARLLDALGIRSTAVFGASAGAPSAMQFCLRHAERCSALVLLVPVAYSPGRTVADTTPPSPFARYALEKLIAPTLLISVQDDLYGTYISASYSARHLPDATMIGYASGGHGWLGHDAVIKAEIGAFLSPRSHPRKARHRRLQ